MVSEIGYWKLKDYLILFFLSLENNKKGVK